MTQLKLDLGTIKSLPSKQVRCPACHQDIKQLNGAYWLKVAELRQMLKVTWDYQFRRLLEEHLAHKVSIDLSGHTWLLWALKSEAKYNGLTLSEQVALIIDSYMESRIRQL